jgi:hypothetical protein
MRLRNAAASALAWVRLCAWHTFYFAKAFTCICSIFYVQENSFNSMNTHWTLNLNPRRMLIFAHGRNNYHVIQRQWSLQVLFANLHTCAYGNYVGRVSLCEPPSIAEYLKNTNLGLQADSREI